MEAFFDCVNSFGLVSQDDVSQNDPDHLESAIQFAKQAVEKETNNQMIYQTYKYLQNYKQKRELAKEGKPENANVYTNADPFVVFINNGSNVEL